MSQTNDPLDLAIIRLRELSEYYSRRKDSRYLVTQLNEILADLATHASDHAKAVGLRPPPGDMYVMPTYWKKEGGDDE